MQLTLDSDGRCVKVNLSQHTYIVDLVEQFDLTLAANPRTTTPLAKCTAVDASGQLLPSNHQYISLVGALNCLATCTRPDIAFAVCQHLDCYTRDSVHSWNIRVPVALVCYT